MVGEKSHSCVMGVGSAALFSWKGTIETENSTFVLTDIKCCSRFSWETRSRSSIIMRSLNGLTPKRDE